MYITCVTSKLQQYINSIHFCGYAYIKLKLACFSLHSAPEYQLQYQIMAILNC